MKTEIMKLRLTKALHLYIKEFEKKHKLIFDCAVNDDLMGVLDFGFSEFFAITDVIEDIDNNYPAGLIIQWKEDTLENHPIKYINLRSYAGGLRYDEI